MIKLKPFTLEDWKYLEQWASNKAELIQFAGLFFSFPIDQNQVKNYLSDSNRIVFTVNTKSEQTIGMAEISIEANNTAKLARVIIGEKSLRGKGMGTELIHMLMAHAF